MPVYLKKSYRVEPLARDLCILVILRPNQFLVFENVGLEAGARTEPCTEVH